MPQSPYCPLPVSFAAVADIGGAKRLGLRAQPLRRHLRSVRLPPGPDGKRRGRSRQTGHRAPGRAEPSEVAAAGCVWQDDGCTTTTLRADQESIQRRDVWQDGFSCRSEAAIGTCRQEQNDTASLSGDGDCSTSVGGIRAGDGDDRSIDGCDRSIDTAKRTTAPRHPFRISFEG